MSILSVAEAAYEDDVVWYPNYSGGYYGSGNTILYLGRGNGYGNSTSGSFRFPVSGLSGATFSAAYITWSAYRGTSMKLNIWGEKTAAPAQIASGADFNTRLTNVTTATVLWTTGTNAGWTTENSVDISAILNELVALNPSYINLLFVDDNSAASGVMDIREYDYGDPIPTLHGTYSTGGSISIPCVMAHRRSQNMS